MRVLIFLGCGSNDNLVFRDLAMSFLSALFAWCQMKHHLSLCQCQRCMCFPGPVPCLWVWDGRRGLGDGCTFFHFPSASCSTCARAALSGAASFSGSACFMQILNRFFLVVALLEVAHGAPSDFNLTYLCLN